MMKIPLVVFSVVLVVSFKLLVVIVVIHACDLLFYKNKIEIEAIF